MADAATARPLLRRACWAALALILALAAHLRLDAALHSEVVAPIRADAAEYFWYAYNLRTFGTYSRRPLNEAREAPPPDSLRPPGYPLFVLALADDPPTLRTVERIALAQALIGVAVTLLAFLLARTIVGPGWALLPAALTAASPHLVVAGTYVLTETLFSLAIVALLLVLARGDLSRRWGWVVVAGVVAGAAALVRPTANYLPLAVLALFFLRWPRPQALRAGAALAAGFALLYGPWLVRNAQLPGGADDQLKINMLHHGMYPDFTYEGAPESFGYPYRADPRTPEIARSMASVTTEIARRFREEPGRHLRWYLFGKPAALWSWNEVQGMGGPFVYPVTRSPYFEPGLAQWTERAMKALNWAAVLLAAGFCVAVWLPRVRAALPPAAVFPAQLCALALIYVTALHMAGFPLPRYATPFRPELFVAATAALWLLQRAWRAQRAAPPVPAP